MSVLMSLALTTAMQFCTQTGGNAMNFMSPVNGNLAEFCHYGKNSYVPFTTLEMELAGTQTEAINLFFLRSSNSVVASSNNPGWAYCESVGGQVLNYSDPRGQMGVCTFEDGSQIDQWTLFRGPTRDVEFNQAMLTLRKS